MRNKILLLFILNLLLISACGNTQPTSTVSSAPQPTVEETKENVPEDILFKRDFYEETQEAILYLSDHLKDPDSLAVRNIFICCKSDTKKICNIDIEYTATNSFGGRMRAWCIYEPGYESLTNLEADHSASYDNAPNEYPEIMKDVYYDKIWENYYFLLDLNDYESQGYSLK